VLLDLPRFRGEVRAWDQGSSRAVILSSGFMVFFGSAPGGAILPSRPARGLVLDGREHDGRLVCVGIDRQRVMSALVVDR
jgi:hypothetical protein